MRNASLLCLLLASIVKADPCPSGYTQAPNGGDCYKLKYYFDDFIGQYTPKSYNDVELDCNRDGGGLLASFHSEEEIAFVQSLVNACKYCGSNMNTLWTNIGLRCIGKDCKWDDGSPVTYASFEQGDEPSDDGKTRCYGLFSDYLTWRSKACGTYSSDCWACSVKAKTIECDSGETSYKGGCVSVHKSPLNQNMAEVSCPGEGHLVSIHGPNEVNVYKQAAVNAGVTGTIYIGGQYINGEFEWLDGSYYNYAYWANGFPNTVFGTCMQMLLASEFGVQGQWTNIDCTVQQSYICFRNGWVYGPTAFPPPPKADAHCPPVQYYTGSATIYSPNYPLSIPSKQSCEYVMGAKEGTRASVSFPTFDVQSGTYLALYDGLNSDTPFLNFTSTPPSLNQWYYATTSVMKMVFSANCPSAPVGTGWEAEFTSASIIADGQCPPTQYFTGSGSIYSPNFPISIPAQQSCEYVLTTKEGTWASVVFPTFNCQSGTSLALYDGVNSDPAFITYTTKSPPPDQWFTATSNVLRFVFSANGTAAPVGTGWEAEFSGYQFA